MPNGRDIPRTPPREGREMRYLTITGLLHPDNRLDLQPGFVTDSTEFAGEDRESELVVEFLDEADALVLRYRVAVSPVCADGARVDHWVVAAKVPYPAGARSLRFLRQDIVIHEARIPQESPVVRLAWEPTGDRRGEQVIRWTGEHPEGMPLTYLVSYSSDGGESWRALSPPIPDTEFAFDFDGLPGGKRCLIGVTATDGFNTVTVTSEPFDAPV